MTKKRKIEFEDSDTEITFPEDKANLHDIPLDERETQLKILSDLVPSAARFKDSKPLQIKRFDPRKLPSKPDVKPKTEDASRRKKAPGKKTKHSVQIDASSFKETEGNGEFRLFG